MALDGCNCYFLFWAIFWPFTSLTAQKIKTCNRMKKMPRAIIILHKCPKNHDHMLHCSWDMGQNNREMDGQTDEKSDI